MASVTKTGGLSARWGLLGYLLEAATMFLAAGISLLILVYVGFGDGKRNYEQIHLEQISAQGALIQNSIEKFVRDGLPLKQYAGFSTVAAPIIEQEEIDAIAVYSANGQLLFSSVDKHKTLKLPEQVSADVTLASKVLTSPDYYQVWLPLKTRFENVGAVVVYTPAALVSGRLLHAFYPIILAAVGLSFAFAGATFFLKKRTGGSEGRSIQITYALTFLAMTIAVVGSLGNLYYDGVQRKAKASAETMAQRLADIVEFGIKFRDLEGLDRVLGEYRRLNPELSAAGLVIDGKVEFANPASLQGTAWKTDSSQFEYTIALPQVHDQTSRALVVSVPRTVVFERALRSVKNFLALFVGSAFLSGLFFQVGGSIQRLPVFRRDQSETLGSEASLIFIKPVFFLAVFFDSLTYSFLPKFMQHAALSSDLSVGYASAPFTAYYLTFALSLIPAGTLAERHGPKLVALIGFVLATIGVMWLSFPLGLWGLTAVRACAGIGQGMILIGVQTYILKVVPPEKKTQGAAVIVFGFQGGLISGMALGSLLVNSLDASGVFLVAGGVALLTLLYTAGLVPELVLESKKIAFSAAVKKIVQEIKGVAKSIEFLNTLLCIGVPAKALLTGVVTFAIPLVLGQYGYRPEDIGQIVMLYGLGVVASSGYVSRLVDRTKNTSMILLAGAVISGTGLWLFGLLGSPWLGEGGLTTLLIAGAVGAVGVAHGFINAPVMTHIAQSRIATQLGSTQVLTAYRFVERGGHVAGPIVLSQLFILMGQGAQVIAVVGMCVALLGPVFFMNRALAERGAKLEPAA